VNPPVLFLIKRIHHLQAVYAVLRKIKKVLLLDKLTYPSMPSSSFYFFSDSFSCFLFLIARRMAKMPNTAIAPTATENHKKHICRHAFASF